MSAATSDFSECQDCVCFAVRRAARAITQHYDRHLRQAGLRTTQFSMLAVLSGGEAQPVNRVARRLGMDRTTLTRNLRPLIDRGYVAIEAGADSRVRLVRITPDGAAAAAAALPHWRRAQRAMARHVTPQALKALAAAERARA
jgi:DNA-binding MarR family transcriptional regulator